LESTDALGEGGEMMDETAARLLAEVLTSKKQFDQLNLTEKTTVVRSAIEHDVVQNLYHHLRQNEIDPETIPNYEDMEQISQARYTLYLRRLHQIRPISQAFQKNNIPLRFFKGFSVSHQAYPAPYLRSMEDVDFLVANTDGKPAISVLKELGFTLKLPRLGYEHPLTWKYEHVFELYRNDLFVDLHTHLHDVRGIMQLTAEQYSWLFQQTIQIEIEEGVQFSVLRPEIELLYVGVHTLMHHFREPSFQNFLDMVYLTHIPALDWDFVFSTAKAFGWEESLYVMLKKVCDIFGSESLRNIPPEQLTKITEQSLDQYLIALRKEFTFWRVLRNVAKRDRVRFFFHLYILPTRQYFQEWYAIRTFWDWPKAIVRFWSDRIATFKRIRFGVKKH
jgi:hypothetical protein